MDVIAAGYLLCIPWEPPAQHRDEWALPPRVLTASPCLAVIGPGPWGFSWVTDDGTSALDRERFGLANGREKEVGTWLDVQRKDGNYGWPNLFLDLPTARSFLRNFQPTGDLVLIGLGLPVAALEPLLSDYSEKIRAREGFLVGLQRGLPLAPNGMERGYEILGEEHGGSFHSWHCNNLAPVVSRELGVTVNQYGLIADYPSAMRATEIVRRPETGAEPVAWDAWLLVEYPTAL